MPKELSAADAVKYFRDAKVQVTKPVTVKGEDGKERPGYETKMAPLGPEHVLAARDYGDKVTVVTIDGRRHEAPKKAA